MKQCKNCKKTCDRYLEVSVLDMDPAHPSLFKEYLCKPCFFSDGLEQLKFKKLDTVNVQECLTKKQEMEEYAKKFREGDIIYTYMCKDINNKDEKPTPNTDNNLRWIIGGKFYVRDEIYIKLYKNNHIWDVPLRLLEDKYFAFLHRGKDEL